MREAVFADAPHTNHTHTLPRTTATGADDDGIWAVESDETIKRICDLSRDIFQHE